MGLRSLGRAWFQRTTCKRAKRGLRSPTKDLRDLVPPYVNNPGSTIWKDRAGVIDSIARQVEDHSLVVSYDPGGIIEKPSRSRAKGPMAKDK